jgi:hypothetical protein
MRSYFRYSQTVSLYQNNYNRLSKNLYIDGCLMTSFTIILLLIFAGYHKYHTIVLHQQIERLEKLWRIRSYEKLSE